MVSRAFSIDGIDPSAHLRDLRVNQAVSPVSSVPRVRELLVEKMRAYASEQDVVMEGRDIGSVVFPHTPYKFYIDASPEIRSQRRAAQGQMDQIAARDQADSARRDSPLTIAGDAHVIDSSHLSIARVVREIMEHLKARGLAECRSMNLSYAAGLYLSRRDRAPFFPPSHCPSRAAHSGRPADRGDESRKLSRSSGGGIASGREMYFLTRKTLLDVPVLGWILPGMNVVPVDQEGTDRSALKALIRILKAGNATVVFPEGARTLDGKLQPALPGLGFVIAKTLAPVLPMRVFGSHEAMPRGRKRLRLHPITIVIGEPMRFSEADLQPARKRTLPAPERASDESDRGAEARMIEPSEVAARRTGPIFRR